jgi:hypothetical protein
MSNHWHCGQAASASDSDSESEYDSDYEYPGPGGSRRRHGARASRPRPGLVRPSLGHRDPAINLEILAAACPEITGRGPGDASQPSERYGDDACGPAARGQSSAVVKINAWSETMIASAR